jgi:hypothetical protein
LGQRRFLAKAEPLLGDPLFIETPHGLLTEVEPPIVRIGPCTKLETDFNMHGPIRVEGCLFALALRVVMMVFDGFEMSGALVFFAQRIIQAHIESPLVGLVSISHQIRHDKVAERGPQVVGCPGTEAETVGAIGGVRCLNDHTI